jgi:hypothetical protein
VSLSLTSSPHGERFGEFEGQGVGKISQATFQLQCETGRNVRWQKLSKKKKLGQRRQEKLMSFSV